jgi:DNA mismatch repair protein MutS2
MSVPTSRVIRVVPPSRDKAPSSRIDVERAPESAEVSERCDLRGLRVDEALDRADAHLQRALGTSLARVVFVHGHGTGALREAIRSWLSELPYLASFEPGGPKEGGDGVTVAALGGPPRAGKG